MKNADDFLIAHVEVAKARFSHKENLGIEFRREVDAWARMETHFKNQIRNPRKMSAKGKHELLTLVYSFRQKID